MIRILALCFGFLAIAEAAAPTFRVTVLPRAVIDMFGLSVFAPTTKGDKIDVTVTSDDSDVYRVTIITKTGSVQRQIIERPTVHPCPACERYLPTATFWVEGGLDRVIVEALMPGPAATSAP